MTRYLSAVPISKMGGVSYQEFAKSLRLIPVASCTRICARILPRRITRRRDCLTMPANVGKEAAKLKTKLKTVDWEGNPG